MKKLVVGLAAIFLSLAAYANGPGGDPGADGNFSEDLHAFEASDDWTTYVSTYRVESELSKLPHFGRTKSQVR